MSLPQLTAFIGENISLDNKGEFFPLIKTIKKVKEEEEAYIVFFVIDLLKENLYFELDKKATEDSEYDYYYFGNNSGSSSQYYLTRATKDLKYLLISTFNDLFLQLRKNNMQNGELSSILKRMQNKGLLSLGDKIGEGKLVLDKFSIIKNSTVDKIELDEQKNVRFGDKKYNPETFIRLFIKDENKKNRFVLVVPKVVVETGEERILCNHPEYLDLVKIENKLGSSDKKSNSKETICHVCKQKKPDVSSSYSTKFSRTGINKIFTTTTINTASGFKKKNYDISYSICRDCYLKLSIGETIISKQFKSRIAGEDAFIIPEGILQDFDYRYLNLLKTDIDLAFKSKDAKTWVKNIESEQLLTDIKNYAVNFIIYRTDGKSFNVLETIEDVPILRFDKIMKTLETYTDMNKPRADNISIGTIYRLIPVRVDKDRNQLDVGRVLSLYKAILHGEKIDTNVLFGYAAEALEKGLSQLEKPVINNYYNMGLTKFKGYEDFYIKRIVYGYLVLLKACQELGVLNYEVFDKKGKGENWLDNFKTGKSYVDSYISNVEKYLDEQGFNNKARALFYLGILVNRVALAQSRKSHKKKPILKKIQFQGMSKKEVYCFYDDIVEKLIQYEKMNLFNEAHMRKFHDYFKSLDDDKLLADEKANVFYIMAGYSYLVGRSGNEPSDNETDLS